MQNWKMNEFQFQASRLFQKVSKQGDTNCTVRVNDSVMIISDLHSKLIISPMDFLWQYSNVLKEIDKIPVLTRNFSGTLQVIQDYDDQIEEKSILYLYEKFAVHLLLQSLCGDFPNGVSLHGDCSNNNIMWKDDVR